MPPDMTTQDQAALAIIGRHMAASNGYRPEQASDLYVDSGTSRDWLYGTYRVFAYTIELSTGLYRPDSVIASETGRNRDAVLYAAERAACPLGVLGATVRVARCGAFDDDLEVNRGWTVNPDGTDTAPASGRWARGVPARTMSGLVTLQPGTATSGRAVFATGLAAGESASAGDLDGTTTIRSAPITLATATGQDLTFRYVWAHLGSSTAADHLRAIVEAANGTQTVVWQHSGAASVLAGSWRSASVSMDRWVGQTVRLRFEATDGGAASTVEAGLDDIRVTQPAP